MGINLQSIIGENIGDAFAKIVAAFKVPPEKALEAKVETDKIQADLASKLQDSITAEINQAGEIIKAEAQSQSWLPRTVRPLLLLLWGVLITVNYIMGVVAQFIHVAYTPVALPDWIYKLTAIGYTGYVGFRSWEKIKDADN